MFQVRAVRFGSVAGQGEIDSNVLGGNPACYRQCGFHAARKFRGDDGERISLAFQEFCGAALGIECIRECSLERRLKDKGSRHPDACAAGSFLNFDLRRHFKRSPATRSSVGAEQSPGLRNRETRRRDTRGAQKITTIHNMSLPTCVPFLDASLRHKDTPILGPRNVPVAKCRRKVRMSGLCKVEMSGFMDGWGPHG